MSHGFSVIIFLFSLVFAIAAPGSLLSFYALESKQQNLAHDPEWLSLIHSHKNIFGLYSSRMHGTDFFLSPLGPTSPEAELVSTLEKFFTGPSGEQKKYQCAFLARRDFLVQRLKISKENLSDCSEYQKWISDLNPQKVSLIFASNSFGNPASSFGHVFLKIQNPKNQEGQDLLNYGINYAARTSNTSGALYAWYGLFGYFPGTYGMAPYHHLIKEYTNMEGRDLWEYELNLTPQEIDHMMKHLLELEKGYFDYYFLDENCAFMIAEALDIARPSLHLTPRHRPWVFPIDVVKAVMHSNLVTRVQFRPSLKYQFNDGYTQLTTSQKKQLYKVKTLAKEANAETAILISKLSTDEIDVAQSYFGLKQAHDFESYKNINFALSQERAKREIKNTKPLLDSTLSPDLASQSTLISLNKIRNASQELNTIKIRGAGYDFLGSKIGHEPYGKFELLSLEVYTDPNQSLVKEFNLVSFLTNNPVTWIETPLSWGFSLGYNNKRWLLPLQVGYAFDLDIFQGSRWLNSLTGQIQESLNNDDLAVPGFESLWIFHFNTILSGLFRFETHLEKQVWSNQYSGGVSYLADKNLEFRYEQKNEHRLSLLYYF